MLLQSFCPSTGAVRSVAVYPSMFGLERMRRDALLGPPKEIWADGEKQQPQQADDDVDAEGDWSAATNGRKKKPASSIHKGFSSLKLRRYELEKLRYYYAVVDCDSVATASAIYTNCDGLEFEQSANVLDLRFIPDGMSFEQQPRDTATEVPSNYVPPTFATRALGSTNVDLTWDADDTGRIQLTSAALKGSAREDDLRAFLASDSEEDEEIADDKQNEQKVEAVRSKYKALLDEIKGENEEQENIEITFVPGLSESAAQMLERKNQKEEELGPWEAHLQKKKEEKKAKKKERKAAAQAQADAEKKPQSREEREAAAAEEKRKAAELELLMLDTNAAKKKGFKLDSMLDDDAKRSKKASRNQRLKQKKNADEKKSDEADGFKVKTNDPRFASLFSQPSFAIDPTSPHFKKTEGMKKILAEKRKRSRDREDADVLPNENSATKSVAGNASLSSLVESVKRKTATAPLKKQK